MWALNGTNSVPSLNNEYVENIASDIQNKKKIIERPSNKVFGIDITNLFTSSTTNNTLNYQFQSKVSDSENFGYGTPKKFFNFDEFEKSTTKTDENQVKSYMDSSAFKVGVEKLNEYNNNYERKTTQICESICDKISNFIMEEEENVHRNQISEKIKDFLSEAHEETLKSLNRSSNINWILDNCLKFKWKENTFYLAVHFLDQFLMNKINAEDIDSLKNLDLKLISAACLLISTKLEEPTQPRVSDFYFICSCKYSCEEIIEQEEEILRLSSYRLVKESPCDFLLNLVDKISKDNDIHEEVLNKVKN